MTDHVDVSPTNKNSTHHISLQAADGSGTKYGLVLTPNETAIQRRPRVGSDHKPFTQNDWSGGRALKFATDDRSRFADSKRLNTRRGGQITLGGMETFVTGHRKAEQYMPSDVAGGVGLTWKALAGSDRFIAHQVTIGTTGNRARIYLWIRRRGTPGALSVRLLNDDAGDPGTQAKLVQVTTSDITDTVSLLYEFTFSSVQAVTATNLFWIGVSGHADDDSADHWEVGVDATDAANLTQRSADGITYADTDYDLYFRLVDDSDLLGAIPFVYKMQLYFLTRPTAANAPKLYMNGYRGVATGAGQSATTLKDTSQTWTTNELAGKVLYIIDGPNSEWQQPYRHIISNDSDEIVTASFGKAHVAGTTTYVILGTNTLTEITGHGLTVLPTSVAAAGDVMYFAQGDSVKMRRMQETRIGATWTRTFAEEDNYAKLLLAYPDDTNRGWMVMKANDYDNSNRPSVSVAKAEAWGKRLKFPYLVDACEATTGWTFSANVTGTADTALYKTGSASIKMVVGGAAPNLIAYRTFSSSPLTFNKKLRFWIYSSNTLDIAGLSVRLSAAADCSTTIQDIELPALAAGEWTLVELPYRDTGGAITTVVTIGFIKPVHSGTIYIDGLEALPAGSEIPLGNEFERINGLELYGDPQVPWVLRTGSVGWIANGTFNPVPLREYTQMENVNNGLGHMVHDVYLYFSFGQGLEEYYRANLDDVGPNRDEGMPEDRQGYISSMIGYPDRLIANYDAGNDGYSSIISRKGGGWHEEYRSDTPGKRIRFIFLQVIPGISADRLWFCEGEDIAWLPMPGNTVNELTDVTYTYTHEGVLELAQIGDEQQRLFSSVKLSMENTNVARSIEWDYKLDEETAWTPSGTIFTSGPVQRIALNKTGKKLFLRFRMQCNNKGTTPRITAIHVSTTQQDEIRYSYTVQFEYRDNGRNLLHQPENYDRAEELIAQLDTWAANKTALTQRSISETFDNKTVFLEPVAVGTLSNHTREQQEKQSATITTTEPP
jgi:hypothetical protein